MNSSVIANEAPWCLSSLPMIPAPASMSIALVRNRVAAIHSGRAPYQFACMPVCSTGVARMPGVHSTVWILAISAALISRAVRNSFSSPQDG